MTNQKKELPIDDWDEMRNVYRGSVLSAFYQVFIHLAAED